VPELRQRPGDQPLPVPNDGPSMHDLVCRDLPGIVGTAAELNAVRDLMAARKQVGIDRYGSLLQAHNGRDCARDLKEELADAAVYARQWLEELADDMTAGDVYEVYEHVLNALVRACGIGDPR
jgi:hypothetical protein